MFEDRMKTYAIPERVYALCQAIKSRTMQESDLRELLDHRIWVVQQNILERFVMQQNS
ncbi:MAG: hypothetical protein ACLR15_07385 [Lachnospiraceae bacterium]